jgi:hypothetical protein
MVLAVNKPHQLFKAGDEVALAEKIKYFYKHSNYKPKLAHPIEINQLVANFIQYIKGS